MRIWIPDASFGIPGVCISGEEWMAAQRSMLEHFAKQSGDSSGAQPGEAPKAEQEEEWDWEPVFSSSLNSRQPCFF